MNSLWNKYPYTDFHEMNLDWILSRIREMESSISNFINLNTIKYADPIAWDITSQYESNTVVIDNQTGNAYISTKAVPYGVHISNTDYWTQIFNYANELDTLREQIAAANEKQSTTASEPRAVDDLVWVKGRLLKIIAPMIAGDSYVIGSNCVYTTIEEMLLDNKALDEEIQARIAADNVLQANIDTEEQARIAADNVLQANINTEEAARISADNALSDRIDGLSKTYINVKDFGAVGDDIHDDTQAFIDAIGDGNRTVYVPTGLYKIRPIEITAQNLRIIGDNWFSSQIRLSETGAAFTVKSNGGCIFENLCFQPQSGVVDSIGIDMDHTVTVRIWHCLFYNNTKYSVHGAGNSLINANSGFMMENSMLISDSCDALLWLEYFMDFTLTNNQFGRVSKLSYDNNYLAVFQHCSNGHMSNCDYWEGKRNVYMYSCEYNRIISNRFESAEEYGLKLELCNWCNIMGNWFNDNSTGNAGIYPHLELAGCEGDLIAENIFGDWNTTDYVKTCINLISHSRDCSIFNNVAKSYTSSFLEQDSTTGVYNNSFDGEFCISTPEFLTDGVKFVGAAVSDVQGGSFWSIAYDVQLTDIIIDCDNPPTNSTDYKFTIEVNGISKGVYYMPAGSYQLRSPLTIDISKGDKVDVKVEIINSTFSGSHYTVALVYAKR